MNIGVAASRDSSVRWKKIAKKAGWALLWIIIIGLIGIIAQRPFLLTPAYKGDGAPPPYDAVISRDRFGVPHIAGTGSNDVAFGIGFAHAEDDFATLQKIYLAVRGRSGEVNGTDGAKTDYVRAVLGIEDLVKRRYDLDVSPEAKRVSEAYAEGLNRYAAAHPEEVVARGLFPLNGRDVAAAAALGAPFFFGMDNVLSALVENRPLPREGGPLEERGSNGFAVAPSRTGDGSTLLLANSHVNLEGPGSWWEAHITTKDGINFSGAVPPGVPLPATGHNGDIAFMSTNNRPDLIDVYKLSLDASGDRYRLDGKWRPLEKRRIWLQVRFGPLVVPVPRYIYRSVHGPVIINKSGAYAIRYAGMNSLRSGTQLLKMLRARDFASWQDAMQMAAIPCFNFIYADKSGQIGIFYNGAFPVRNPQYNWRGILPGDTSNAITVAEVSWSDLPRTVNPKSGYVFSSNNAPWLASGPGDSPRRESFPAWLGAEDDLTNRSLRASALLDASTEIDAARLLEVKNDKGVDRRSFIGSYVSKTLAADFRNDPELSKAQALLRKWDWNFDGQGIADGFAHEFIRPISRRSYARLTVPPPAQALRDATKYLKAHFGRIDVPLRSLTVLRRGSDAVASTGGPDVLRTLISYAEPGTGAPKAVFGDSFIMLVRWDKSGKLTSQTVVPFGASARPGTPHSFDQAPLFASEKFKPAWYSPEELQENIVRSYRPK